ncbi:MAG: DUF2336 domain-containing protein [Pseudomonadota bacterium]
MTQPETTLSPAQDDLPVSLDDAVDPQVGEIPAPHGPMTGARVLVARKMADIVVLPVGILTANERALAGDILLQILDKVDYDLRVDLAERISRVPDVPETIVRALITDRPDVAASILEGMEVISDSLLIECVRHGDPAHRLMVARRFGLTTAVADAIFEFDEADVAKLILRRPECALSQTAIETLVSRSTVDETLQALLIERDELEPAHGFMMFWWVGTSNRRRILSRFSLDRSTIQEALQGLYPVMRLMQEPDGLVKEILDLNDRRHRPRGLNGEVVSMDVVKRTLALARQYPSEEIIEALGMIAGISRELAARILRDPGGEPYAVMCKSLGIARTDFFEFLCGRAEGVFDDGGESALSPERAEELLDVFDRMARDFARAVLRYWDWNGNPRMARVTRLIAQNTNV